MAENENVLSPEELDALSAGLEDGSIEANAGLNTLVKAVKHDIVKKDSSKGINIDAINPINDRFLVRFKEELSTILRSKVKGSSETVRLVPYGDYLKEIELPVACNVVRVKPLHGTSLIIIQPKLLFRCFDSFFGGEGDRSAKLSVARSFTPTEISINNILVNIIFASLEQAWSPVEKIQCSAVALANSPKSADIVEGNDLVLVTRINIELADGDMGVVDIVYPYYSLKTIRESLVRPSSENVKDDLATQWSLDLKNAVLDAELKTTVSLAQIETTLKAFEALREEDIIFFAKPNFATMDVENIPVYEGHVGMQSSNMAIQLVRPQSGS
ncbi:MAG TPA: flagellar motor switch protein FliM [Porticoccaceae bacterium]|nr:flagellar motor switch protein FliM [Porticoccaceae bacterium]